jgi:hypothetical protein
MTAGLPAERFDILVTRSSSYRVEMLKLRVRDGRRDSIGTTEHNSTRTFCVPRAGMAS